MKLFKFSIIGYGSMGHVHHKAIDEFEDIVLDSVLEVDSSKIKKIDKNIKVFSDFNTYLDYLDNEKIDGVIISSPNIFHYEQAKELIKQKIPLLVEKPLVQDQKDLETLINLSIKNKSILRCGLIEIYNPIVTELKQIKISDLKTVTFTRHSPRVSSDRNLGDVLLDLLLHDISLLYYLFNPEKIEIVGKNFLKHQGAIETSELLLLMNGKVSVFLTTSRESQLKKRKIEIICKNSVYSVDLIQKIIYITENGKLKSNSKSFTEANINYRIEPLDRPETAKVQLKKFKENIILGSIDKNHLKLVNDCHNFIFSLI